MHCPICGKEKTVSFFAKAQSSDALIRKMSLTQCANCRVVFAQNYQVDRKAIYNKNYATWGADLANELAAVSEAKKVSFVHQLEKIKKFIDPQNKKLLDVGTGGGFLLEVATAMGFNCFGIEPATYACQLAKNKFGEKIFCGTLEQARYPDIFFDVICLTDVLEHLKEPLKTLQEVNRILKPGGFIFVISPDTNSLSKKILGTNWFQYKYEHLFYFNKKSFRFIMEEAGFEIALFTTNVKKLSLAYYRQYFKKYRLIGVSRVFNLISDYLPRRILKLSFSNPITGEFLAIARKKNIR